MYLKACRIDDWICCWDLDGIHLHPSLGDLIARHAVLLRNGNTAYAFYLYHKLITRARIWHDSIQCVLSYERSRFLIYFIEFVDF